MPTLKNPCKAFFDRLPTVKSSAPWKHNEPVLRVERGDGGGIVPVACRAKIRSQYTNLLGYFWIDRVFLLGKGRQSKTDCQSYWGKY